MESTQAKQRPVFENVWRRELGETAGQVVDLWRDHGGPTGDAARERLGQLVFLVKNENSDVVGASTAYKVYVPQLRNYFFAIRLMLSSAYRMPGLTSKLIVSTRDFLESIHGEDETSRAIGVITLVENERIKKNRNEAVWPASGMVYIGNSSAGHHIRVYYFKGARIAP